MLGPSATWAWQRLARLAGTRPGVTIDTTDLATSLGLGSNLGPNAAVSRTLARLVAFGAARRGADTLAVRLALPDLPARRAATLSPTGRLAHDRLSRAHLPMRPATTLAAEAAANLEQPAGVAL